MMIVVGNDVYEGCKRMCFYYSKDNRKAIVEINQDWYRENPTIIVNFDFERDIDSKMKFLIKKQVDELFDQSFSSSHVEDFMLQLGFIKNQVFNAPPQEVSQFCRNYLENMEKYDQ